MRYKITGIVWAEKPPVDDLPDVVRFEHEGTEDTINLEGLLRSLEHDHRHRIASFETVVRDPSLEEFTTMIYDAIDRGRLEVKPAAIAGLIHAACVAAMTDQLNSLFTAIERLVVRGTDIVEISRDSEPASMCFTLVWFRAEPLMEGSHHVRKTGTRGYMIGGLIHRGYSPNKHEWSVHT